MLPYTCTETRTKSQITRFALTGLAKYKRIRLRVRCALQR